MEVGLVGAGHSAGHEVPGTSQTISLWTRAGSEPVDGPLDSPVMATKNHGLALALASGAKNSNRSGRATVIASLKTLPPPEQN